MSNVLAQCIKRDHVSEHMSDRDSLYDSSSTSAGRLDRPGTSSLLAHIHRLAQQSTSRPYGLAGNGEQTSSGLSVAQTSSSSLISGQNHSVHPFAKHRIGSHLPNTRTNNDVQNSDKIEETNLKENSIGSQVYEQVRKADERAAIRRASTSSLGWNRPLGNTLLSGKLDNERWSRSTAPNQSEYEALCFSDSALSAQNKSSVRSVCIVKDVRYPCSGLKLTSYSQGQRPGIFVQNVQTGSPAARAGIRCGDQLLSIGQLPLTLNAQYATEQLRAQLQRSGVVFLKIREAQDLLNSLVTPVVGLYSNYRWVDAQGKTVAPPSQLTRGFDFVTINVDGFLGLMIKGGIEYGIGIFITGVDRGSKSDQAGLKVGDEIVSVNEHDFRRVTHDEAVRILRNSTILRLLILHVGAVPILPKTGHTGHSSSSDSGGSGFLPCYAPRSLDWPLDRSLDPFNSMAVVSHHLPYYQPPPNSPLLPHMSPIQMDISVEQLLNKKLMVTLEEQDQLTFRLYLEEYQCNRMDVQTFVGLLLQLLNTSHKYALLDYVRPLISTNDLDKFDELLFRREEHRIANTRLNSQLLQRVRQLNNVWSPSCQNHTNSFMSNPHTLEGRRWSDSLPSQQAFLHMDRVLKHDKRKSLSGYALDHAFMPAKNRYYDDSKPDSLVPKSASDSDEYPLLPNQLESMRRHRSLPGERTIEQPLQRPQRSQQRRPSFGPSGKMCVKIRKIKPILGIAIEGGINVPNQPQPRIISIHATGSAYQTGELRVGHIILQIDGKSTEGLTHSEVAQLLAQSYYTNTNEYLELVVREKCKNELDLRRNSFMLINNSYE